MILTSVAAKETAEINVNEIEIKATEIALTKKFIIFPPFF